jgi:p-cumate 2,3-dioxygenase subunit alpha
VSEFVYEDRSTSTFRINRESFTSADVLTRERSEIFDRSWIFVGHESEVPSPNRYLTRRVAGRPVIFMRDRVGALRVLLNSCRHRGAEVCRASEGEAKIFTCFYHGWAYHNTGELAHIPDRGAYGDDYDTSALGLAQPAHVSEYRGFVFANFDPAADDLESYLGDGRLMLDLIADQSESGMRIVPGVHSYWMNANWKLLMENSCDGYHAKSVHQTYFEMMMNLGVMPGVVQDDPSVTNMRGAGVDLGNGHASTLTWPGRGAGALMTTDSIRDMYDQRRAALFARFDPAHVEMMTQVSRNSIFFPNFVAIDLTFGIQLRTMWPTTPDSTEITGWLLTVPELDEELQRVRLDNALTFWGPGGLATPDDIEALEQCQRGFATATEAPWTDLSKGFGREIPDITDELPQRTFWREWNRRITGEELSGEGRRFEDVASLPVYASAGAEA